MSYLAGETSPVAAVALLLHLGCPEDKLTEALAWLSGRPVPKSTKDMLAMAREAIEFTRIMTIADE